VGGGKFVTGVQNDGAARDLRIGKRAAFARNNNIARGTPIDFLAIALNTAQRIRNVRLLRHSFQGCVVVYRLIIIR